jgi:uncharacterized protein YigA (DUF484 family)
MGANEQGHSRTSGAPKRPLAWAEVRDFLKSDPTLVRDDAELLQELGLRIHAANVVDFIPPALARRALANVHETAARRELEAIARANFAAQAQTHATVVDLLESRNHADLARRLDDTARLRFDLVAGVIALEEPGRAPAGWRTLGQGMCDALMGPQGLARMGMPLYAEALFGEDAPRVGSVAMVRLAIWEPARQGVLAFASREPDGFTGDMGVELVAFIARVIERTAERWPVL